MSLVGLMLLLSSCGAQDSKNAQPTAVVPVPLEGASLTPAPTDEALKYVMEGSDLLIVIDMKRLASSELFRLPQVKSWMEKTQHEPPFKQWQSAGIDLLVNVDSVVISGSLTSENAAIAVSGSFDRERGIVVTINADEGFNLSIILQALSESDTPKIKTYVDEVMSTFGSLLPPDMFKAIKTDAQGTSTKLSLFMSTAQFNASLDKPRHEEAVTH